MHSLIKKSLIVVGGCVIFSEIAYQLYLKYDQLIKRKSEINEVFFINYSSKSCLNHELPGICTNKLCHINSYERLIQLIDSAQTSIYLSMYTFTLKEIGDAIIRAHERKIIVKVIWDESMVFSSGSQCYNFVMKDIPLRYKKGSSSIMHHKFCLIDTMWNNKGDKKKVLNVKSQEKKCEVNDMLKREITKNGNKSDYSVLDKTRLDTVQLPEGGILISGSLNWTAQGFNTNWENVIITSNKTIVESFQLEFERMWRDFETSAK